MKKRPASLPFWPSSLPCRCAKLLQCIWLIATLWTIAHQAPLPMGSSRQEYWSRLPYPPPGNLPDPGIESESLMSPALAGRFFTTSATWETLGVIYGLYYVEICSFYSYFLESFYHRWVSNFVKSFLCIYWDDHMVFIFHFIIWFLSFSLLVWCITSIDSDILKNPF